MLNQVQHDVVVVLNLLKWIQDQHDGVLTNPELLHADTKLDRL